MIAVAAPLKLQIGAKGPGIDGFKKVDIVQHGDVDYVRDARDLSCFDQAMVDEIYASHILEHFPMAETLAVLKEWGRALKDGGTLWVAVPDFDAIVNLYVNSGRMLSTWTEYLIHGDQSSPQDFHYRCFTYNTLAKALSDAGFTKIKRLVDMPYNVPDASHIRDSWFQKPISLNIQAIK